MVYMHATRSQGVAGGVIVRALWICMRVRVYMWHVHTQAEEAPRMERMRVRVYMWHVHTQAEEAPRMERMRVRVGNKVVVAQVNNDGTAEQVLKLQQACLHVCCVHACACACMHM